KARLWTAAVYQVTNDGAVSRDFGLRDQIRRAAVSVLSNIAEGHERARASEFYRFLSIAEGSCAELRARLHVALDAGYLQGDSFEGLPGQTEEVGRILGGLRASVERRIEKQ